MKLPPSSLLASIAVASLPLISASDVPHDGANSNAFMLIDTGILIEASPVDDPAAPFLSSRSLQSTCPDTCSSDLCSCVAQYGYAEPCSQQLHDVCTGVTGSISDCVVPEYVFYYTNVYCPFAACRVSGDSYESCQCASYVNFCGIYQNKEGYADDPKTLKYCSIATCCAAEDTDEGRGGCLESSFKNDAVASIADLVGGTEDTTTATDTAIELAQSTAEETTTDAVEAEAPPPSGANGLKSSILSMAVGALAWSSVMS
jgi:hypothetical protein